MSELIGPSGQTENQRSIPAFWNNFRSAIAAVDKYAFVGSEITQDTFGMHQYCLGRLKTVSDQDIDNVLDSTIRATISFGKGSPYYILTQFYLYRTYLGLLSASKKMGISVDVESGVNQFMEHFDEALKGCKTEYELGRRFNEQFTFPPDIFEAEFDTVRFLNESRGNFPEWMDANIPGMVLFPSYVLCQVFESAAMDNLLKDQFD